jgi:hypothetical protein
MLIVPVRCVTVLPSQLTILNKTISTPISLYYISSGGDHRLCRIEYRRTVPDPTYTRRVSSPQDTIRYSFRIKKLFGKHKRIFE